MNMFKRFFTKFNADLDMEKDKEERRKQFEIEHYDSLINSHLNLLHLRKDDRLYTFKGYKIVEDTVVVKLTTSKGDRTVTLLYYYGVLEFLNNELSKSRERFIDFELQISGFNLKLINENNIQSTGGKPGLWDSDTR